MIAPKDHAVGINTTVARPAVRRNGAVLMTSTWPAPWARAEERGIWVLGTSGDADKSLYQADLQGPVALVLGAGGRGCASSRAKLR